MRRPAFSARLGAALAVVSLFATIAASTAPAEVLGSFQGLTYVQKEGFVVHEEAKTLNPKCPDDRPVLGGGINLTSGDTAGVVVSNFPQPGSRDAWLAKAYNTNTSATDIGMTAYAICGRKALDVRYAERKRTLAGADQGARSAECPGGTHVAAGGVKVGGPPAGAFLNSSYPISGTVPDQGWAGFVHSTAGQHTFTVRVACVPNQLGLDYIQGQTTLGLPPPSSAPASSVCNPSLAVTGGGVFVDPGAQLNDLGPYDGIDGDTLPADGYHANPVHLSGGEKTVVVHAICKGPGAGE